MNLPKNFQFSATSLQDYVDCARRFQLRYVLQVTWPAPQADPVDEHEHRYRAGREFHKLVHQYLLGIPAEALSASVDDPDLDRWWRAFLSRAAGITDDKSVIPEIGLSTPIEGYRLVAQYDAIIMMPETREDADSQPGSFSIIDWKTYPKCPPRAWFATRLQTRVYPQVLVQAGAQLNGGRPVEPNQVEMRYWLAEHPDKPEIFRYDTRTHQSDMDYVAGLIDEIVVRSADEIWPLTDQIRRCQFCNYRSLCRRGDVAGPLDEYPEGDEYAAITESDSMQNEATPDFDLDWGQVQEIAY